MLDEGLVLLKPSWLAGLFIFPLDEGTTVVGFEAVICQRAVTVQIKDKAKIDDVYLNSISLPDGGAPNGGGERVWSLLRNTGSQGEGEVVACGWLSCAMASRGLMSIWHLPKW